MDIGRNPAILAPESRLQAQRNRAEALRAAKAAPARLTLDDATESWQRLRVAGRELAQTAAAAYEPLCPPGYPQLEDNGIEGPGGSVGVRFSVWHAFHFAFQNAKKLKKPEPKPTGLAGALDIRVKRMPGDPLPPRDPEDRFELAVLGLRWDADRGWVETRSVLPARWDLEMLLELLEAYLAGFNYDVAAGLPERA